MSCDCTGCGCGVVDVDSNAVVDVDSNAVVDVDSKFKFEWVELKHCTGTLGVWPHGGGLAIGALHVNIQQ